MTNPNQRVQFPFGDAFIVDTPNIDRVSQQLYMEQKQREAQQERNNAAMDDAFSKNLYKIRDADAPELVKKYDKWKNLKINAAKKRGRLSIEEQGEILKAQSDMDSHIASSAADKEWEEGTGKDIKTNYNRYKTDATGYLVQRRGLPLSKIDRNKDNEIYYKGSLTNFDPLLKNAEGSQVDAEAEIEKLDDYYNRVKSVKRYNTPSSRYNNIIGGIVGSQGHEDFVKTFGTFTPEQYDAVKKQYETIMADPTVQKRWGTDAVGGLPPDDNLKTDAEKIAKFNTMLWATNHTPIVAGFKDQPNETKLRELKRAEKIADDERNFEQQKQYAAIQNKYATDRIIKAAKLKSGQGKEDDILSADTVLSGVSDIINSGESDNGLQTNWESPFADLKGEKVKVDAFRVSDPGLLKTFEGVFNYVDDKGVEHSLTPTASKYDKNKDELQLIYQNGDGSESIRKLRGREYMAIKVKQKFPNKDIGTINNIIEKVYKDKGNLYNIAQMYKDKKDQSKKVTDPAILKQLESQ